jgi:hypothetical protein
VCVGGGGSNAIERWQNKVRLFHRMARGWSVNIESENRKRERETESRI